MPDHSAPFVGASGCGKSTFCALLLSRRPTHGAILLDGEPLPPETDSRKSSASCFSAYSAIFRISLLKRIYSCERVFETGRLYRAVVWAIQVGPRARADRPQTRLRRIGSSCCCKGPVIQRQLSGAAANEHTPANLIPLVEKSAHPPKFCWPPPSLTPSPLDPRASPKDYARFASGALGGQIDRLHNSKSVTHQNSPRRPSTTSAPTPT